MELGQKIELSRKKKRLSQDDLAGLLNVDLKRVQDWEAGIEKPDTNQLIEISNSLEVSLDFLLKNNNNTIAVSSPKPSSPTKRAVKHINPKRHGAIKAWLIVGCVLSPLVTGASLISAAGLFSLIALSLYCITIPFCSLAIRCSRNAKSREDLIGWGVTSLIMVSVIGGIIMLSTSDNDFVVTYEEVKPKPTVTSQQAAVIVTNTIKTVQAPTVDINYLKREARKKLYKARQKLKFIKDEKQRQSIAEKLNNIQPEIENITKEQQYTSIKNRIEIAIEPAQKNYIKRNIIWGGISLTIAAVVALAIVIPVSIAKADEEKQARAARDQKRQELWNLVYNYSSPAEDNYIQKLFNDLSPYYNLSEERKYYSFGVAYYNLTRQMISYSGSSDNKAIEENINKISDTGYRDIRLIKEDFEKVKNYSSHISYKTGSGAADAATSNEARYNRMSLNFLYTDANKSGKWDYDYLLNKIPTPYLIKGIQCSCEDNNFYWYTDDSNNDHLSWNLPKPAAYNPLEDYYFATYYSSSNNNLTFRLVKKSDSTQIINLFIVQRCWYKNGEFYCYVYLYGSGLTNTFSFPIQAK